MKTDIEIAHDYKMQDIRDIAKKSGIVGESLSLYGNYMAKVSVEQIDETKVQRAT